MEHAQDGSTNKRHFSARRSQTLSASFMFQPICKPASTKTHIKKQHITGAQKDGKFPFRDSQKKSKSTATKMIKFGVFPELDKEKKNVCGCKHSL